MTPAAIKEAQSKPTPKRASGVPDFTGLWVGTRPRDQSSGGARPGQRQLPDVLRSRTGTAVDFERDAGVRQRVFRARRALVTSQWQQVQVNDVHGHSLQAQTRISSACLQAFPA